jgi:thioredoxin-related protein
MTFFPEVAMADRSKLGLEFPLYSMPVEKIKIAEFIAAVEQKEDTRHIKDIYRDVDAAKKALRKHPHAPVLSHPFCLLDGRRSSGNR